MSPAVPVQVTHGTSVAITIAIEDLNGNPMAAGTTVAIATADSGATLGGQVSWTIGCRDVEGGPGVAGYASDTTTVNYKAPATAGGGTVTVTVTSPGSKAVTSVGIPITIN